MSNIALQGPEKEILELQSFLKKNKHNSEQFNSEGFDGASLATLIVDLTQILAPPVAAVFAAKIASKKEIKLKVNGIEVSAGSENEVLKVLDEVTQAGIEAKDAD